jgi:hypothetical protein
MRTTIHHLALLLFGCGVLLGGPACAAEFRSPRLNPDQDHIMAWVPADQAATAGVAQALVHLQLDKALRAAEAELCQGSWQLSPKTLERNRPQAVTAPASLGAQAAWYYRLSREAETPDDCGIVDRSTFQRTVSRHLPAWMVIQPAQRRSLWQQGHARAADIWINPNHPQTLALQQ